MSDTQKREELTILAYNSLKQKCDELDLELDNWEDLDEHIQDTYRVTFNAGVLYGQSTITWVKPK